MQLNIDKHGSISSTFEFICHGVVGTTERFSLAKPTSTQLVMERGRVARPVGDVCKGGQIWVAFNTLPKFLEFDLKDGRKSMVEYDYSGLTHVYSKHITFPYEILYSFINEHQLSPIFVYNQGNWGNKNPETGRWSGTLGMVRGDIVLRGHSNIA